MATDNEICIKCGITALEQMQLHYSNGPSTNCHHEWGTGIGDKIEIYGDLLVGGQADDVDEVLDLPAKTALAANVLYMLLETDPTGLRTLWNQHFQEAQLEKVANDAGYSFD